ncbi:MAG: substrate-binding domain-containing protein, partial [Pseudomonadota bacterium]
QGYHILIFMTSNDEAEVDKVVKELLDYRVDGIITASVAMTNAIADRCSDAGIPVVMFNRGQDGSGHSSVTSANIEGGRKVAEFLTASGHQRIAHISGWQGSSTGRDRRHGFEMGLTQLEVAPVAIVDGMFKRDTAAAAAEAIVKDHSPDAIFVGNDHMAFAVMDVVRSKLGLRVPEDISIVGYDDVPEAAWAAYDLTTVRQPVNRMVEATVDTLLGEIDQRAQTPQKTQIDGPLIVRGSARVPEGWTP